MTLSDEKLIVWRCGKCHHVNTNLTGECEECHTIHDIPKNGIDIPTLKPKKIIDDGFTDDKNFNWKITRNYYDIENGYTKEADLKFGMYSCKITYWSRSKGIGIDFKQKIKGKNVTIDTIRDKEIHNNQEILTEIKRWISDFTNTWINAQEEISKIA